MLYAGARILYNEYLYCIPPLYLTLLIPCIYYTHTLHRLGSLPWQGLKAKNAQRKYGLILEKKQQVSIGALCHGLPSQFADYLVSMYIYIYRLVYTRVQYTHIECITCYICYYAYIHIFTCIHCTIHYSFNTLLNPPLYNTTQAYTRSLRFDSKPDTAYLKKLFRDLYVSLGIPFSNFTLATCKIAYLHYHFIYTDSNSTLDTYKIT